MSVGDSAELRVYDRDGVTLRGTIVGGGLSWSHAKGVDTSDASLSANLLEDDMTAALLDDALGIVYVENALGVMIPVGTPYVLTPSSGTVIGSREGAAAEIVPVGKGALMLTAEWLVLHHGGVVKRRGGRDMYYGWMSPEFDSSAWETPEVATRAGLAADAPKKGEPRGWVDTAADWIYLPGSTLILFVAPVFTVATARLYRIAASADEEFKVYLNGELIMEESQQETGYTQMRVWNEVLAPGDYQLAVEMTTVNTEGGDGFDGLSLSVTTVDAKNRPNLPAVMNSGADWLVHGQLITAERPGLTVGQLLGILRAENIAWGVASASLLVPTFTDALDSDGVAWPDLKERSWPIGTTVAQVLSDLLPAADFDVSVDFDWHAYVEMGADLSATVQLRKGSTDQADDENVIEYRYQSTPITATRAVVLTEHGYAEVIDTGDEATIPARAVYLESSQSVGIGAGRRLAQDVIDEQSVIHRTFTAQVRAVTGCVPHVDFSIADTIQGLNRTGGPKDLHVVSIAGAQGESAPVIFTLELAEV